jgi:hypothetical protein
MVGQSKTEHILIDWKEFFGFPDKLPKKLSEILGELSEEEIQNHYNVYVYKVLPNPPDKKESLTK